MKNNKENQIKKKVGKKKMNNVKVEMMGKNIQKKMVKNRNGMNK